MARVKKELKAQATYTTFQITKVLGISAPTVAKLIDSGLLEGFRTEGGHRRVTHAALLRYAASHGVELPAELLASSEDNRRVLVVDDERDFADMVAEFLRHRCGVDVATAESGFHAGQQVERFRPGLILMDLMMPDMNGFDAFRQLRSDASTAGIPVVACTAYRDASLDKRVTEAGFDGFVEKPVDLDSLRDLIESFLSPR